MNIRVTHSPSSWSAVLRGIFWAAYMPRDRRSKNFPRPRRNILNKVSLHMPSCGTQPDFCDNKEIIVASLRSHTTFSLLDSLISNRLRRSVSLDGMFARRKRLAIAPLQWRDGLRE